MLVQVYLYKRHDLDLLALLFAGYPVSTMMKQALVSYAHGTPLFYYIDEIIMGDYRGVEKKRIGFRIGNRDTQTQQLLAGIQKSKRVSFCKMVLRNALIAQNLTCLFANQNLANLHASNVGNINLNNFPNIVPLSSIKEQRSFEFLGKTYTVPEEKAYTPTVLPQVTSSVSIRPMSVQNTGPVVYEPQNVPVLNVSSNNTKKEKPIEKVAENTFVPNNPVPKAEVPAQNTIRTENTDLSISSVQQEYSDTEISETTPAATTETDNDNDGIKMSYDNKLFSLFDNL